MPIFEVVSPAVRAAVKVTSGRIGVIGTRATINSQVYKKLIHQQNPSIKVFSQAAPLLVPLVEEGWLKKQETKKIVKRYLKSLRSEKIDTLILACTHYPFLRTMIQTKIGRKVKIIDPGEEVAKEIKEFLAKNSEIEKTLIKGLDHKFFVSDLTPKFQELATKWLEQKIKLERINL
ncbi:MAG: aspartate/glutamate racemase family protein [Patescibacteria group bacterium]